MNGTRHEIPPVSVGKAGKWTVVASVGSILSAFVASICCVGPLVFALLGVSGAGLFAELAPYRPYLILATFAFLGAGFYFAYRRPRVALADETSCDCATPRTNRVGKIMLWVATFLVVAFLVFPYVADWIFG